MSLHAIQTTVRQQVDEALSGLIHALPGHAPELKAAMLYALTVGGKRMRPLLVHLTGNMLDLPRTDQLTISMAIECVHAYSLVHDDLPAMDDDDLRRGHPTCHIKFNEATAILAGDALQTLAFSILAEQPLSRYGDKKRATLIASLAKASGYLGMCGGQAIDLASTGHTITLDQLKQLHRLKTGALLTACVDMACKASEAITPDSHRLLCEFAELIGLAFQVQDDILDLTASTETLGKPNGSDVALGKNTFPSLLGLEPSRQELAKLHQQALQALDALPYNTDYLVAFTDLMVNRDH